MSSGNADQIAEMQRKNVDVGAMFEPRVSVIFTMAATKARDIGVVVESKGNPTDAQADDAVRQAARAFAAAHEIALAFHQRIRNTEEGGPQPPLNIESFLGK